MSQFATLKAWCDDWSAATGDARFGILAQLLDLLDVKYGEQGVPTMLHAEIDGLLRQQLPDILAASDAADGALLARSLLADVTALPWSVQEWRAEGWV